MSQPASSPAVSDLARAAEEQNYKLAAQIARSGIGLSGARPAGKPLLAYLAAAPDNEQLPAFAWALLLAGLDPNQGSPLALALEKPSRQNLALAQILLDNGADPNLPGASGNPPIAICAQNGYMSGLLLLLRAGADPDARNARGLCAAQIALAAGRFELARMLWRESKAKPQATLPLHAAFESRSLDPAGCLAFAREMIQCRYADPAESDGLGRNALRLACDARAWPEALLIANARPGCLLAQACDGCSPVEIARGSAPADILAKLEALADASMRSAYLHVRPSRRHGAF